MTQVPLQELSGEKIQENGIIPTGFYSERSPTASISMRQPLRRDRYLQGVPYRPHSYYGKSKEAESEDQANASTYHMGLDSAVSIPPYECMYMSPFPPGYIFGEEPEEKKIQWPEGLLKDEMERIRELGLGKAIDSTLSNPWANKKAYEAREVKLQDLVVTNEGNRIKRFAEEIESYYEVQGRIAQTVRIPDKPIDVSVAAESHRSHCGSYSMKGTTIITRTISFEIGGPPCGVDAVDGGDRTPDVLGVDTRSKFEKRLDQWVRARRGESDLEADHDFDDKTNSYCREFLESLGGATHYVSSITLGAMSYKVKSTSSSTTQISQESSVKVPRAVGIMTSGSVKTGSSRKRSDEQEIGQIPEDGLIKVRSPAEAVIRYSFTPLTNLVSNLELRAYLQRAIQQYFESFKKRGPFRIMSAEPIKIVGKDSLVYWKVKSGQTDEDATASKYKYEIVGTVDAKEASNFFIHPDISDKNGVWFFITTDPEEKHTQVDPSGMRTPSMTVDSLALPEISTKGGGIRSIKTTLDAKPDVSDVERYVHMCAHNGSLVLEARSIVDKKLARFRLVDRLQHTKVPLKASSWLPQTQLGSALVLPGDPYFIQPSFSLMLVVHKRCLALHVSEICQLTHIRSILRIGTISSNVETSRENEPKYRYSFDLKRHQKEHKLGADMMLFALVKGKHT